MHDCEEQTQPRADNPVNGRDNAHQIEDDPRGDPRGHRPPGDWMPDGRGRGGRRAMMRMMMSMDPSDMPYWMDQGRFGFGGRGGGRGRGGWFGFGGRGRGCWGGRGRHGRRFMDDDNIEIMAEEMDDCQLNERRRRRRRSRSRSSSRSSSSSGSSSSSSSSSDSDDDAHGPDVQRRPQIDGEDREMGEKSTEPDQKGAKKSEKPGRDRSPSGGRHGRRHGRDHHGHHKRRHGKRHHGGHRHGRHHHRHFHSHHSMMPPPHHHGFDHGFDAPPFHPMYHAPDGFPGYHGDRHMAKKFFKKSMKMWLKAQKKAWKHQQGDHQPAPRPDDDETATSGFDNDLDMIPPPWWFFLDDHHVRRHGRHCFGGHGRKRHGRCDGERHGDDARKPPATKQNEADIDHAEEVCEILDECDDDQMMMEEANK